jgi:hypothetical membrane protein
LDNKRSWFRGVSVLEIVFTVWAGSAILMGVGLSPWFNWFDNAISDLGVSSVAPLFNSSLIICGVMSIVFASSYMLFEKEKKIGVSASFLLLLASISLIGVGVFTEDFPPYHFIFSILFFVFSLLASLTMGVRLISGVEYRYLGVYSIIIGILGAIAWALPIWNGVAIPEAITIYPVILLAIFLAIRMYKKS